MRTERAPWPTGDVLLTVLSLSSGATAAFSFLGLGSVFTGVMTGNLVVLGVSIGRGDVDELSGTVIALVCYTIGVLVTARYLARHPKPAAGVWGPAIGWCLGVMVVLQAGAITGWLVTGTQPPAALRDGVIAVSALAMGTQSAAVRTMSIGGVSTTYLTGTLTNLVAGLATGGGWHRDHTRAVGAVGGVVAGAALESLLLWTARPVGPVLPLVATAATLAVVLGHRAPPHPAT